jgi:hypothetical protein
MQDVCGYIRVYVSLYHACTWEDVCWLCACMRARTYACTCAHALFCSCSCCYIRGQAPNTKADPRTRPTPQATVAYWRLALRLPEPKIPHRAEGHPSPVGGGQLQGVLAPGRFGSQSRQTPTTPLFYGSVFMLGLNTRAHMDGLERPRWLGCAIAPNPSEPTQHVTQTKSWLTPNL